MTISKQKFVILGQDQWSIEEKIRHLLQQQGLSKQKCHFFHFRITEDELKVIIEEVQSRSFFATKVIVIKAKSWNKLKTDEKRKLIKAVETSNNWIFILFPDAISLTTKQLFEKIMQFEKIEKITTFKKKKFIIKIFKKKNVCVQPQVVEYLSENLASNLMNVEKEINKITNYLEAKPQVLNIELAKKITNQQGSGTIFPLVEGLLENNKRKIIESYQQLARENQINVLVFLATLQTYIFLLKKTQILLKENTKFTTIVKKIKKSNFFVVNLIRITRKTNEQKLGNLIKKMYNLERRVKTSPLKEDTLLELFLVT